jgi:hypothetical protein
LRPASARGFTMSVAPGFECRDGSTRRHRPHRRSIEDRGRDRLHRREHRPC